MMMILMIQCYDIMMNVPPNHHNHTLPVAQWLEHCASSAKVVGSIPREHMY